MKDASFTKRSAVISLSTYGRSSFAHSAPTEEEEVWFLIPLIWKGTAKMYKTFQQLLFSI